MEAIKFFAVKRAGVCLFTGLGLVTLIGGCARGPVSDVSVESGAAVAEQTALKNLDTQNPQTGMTEATADVTTEAAIADQPRTGGALGTPVRYDNAVAIASPTSPAIEIGLSYAEARTQLIQQGWVPDPQPDPGPYGVERTMHDVGFTEVSACAGSGAGQCRFEFYHPDRMASGEENVLSVITYGGSRPEVADWTIQSVASTTSTSSSTAATPVSQSTIPEQFQGLWNFDVQECSVPYSQGQLLLEAGRVKFYESSGPVTDVIVRGDLSMTVYTELSSEGITSVEMRNFELSSDRTILTDTSTDAIRYRCPDA